MGIYFTHSSAVGRSPTHVPRPTITRREMEEQALLNWAHTRITTITLSYLTHTTITLSITAIISQLSHHHNYHIILLDSHNYHIIYHIVISSLLSQLSLSLSDPYNYQIITMSYLSHLPCRAFQRTSPKLPFLLSYQKIP